MRKGHAHVSGLYAGLDYTHISKADYEDEGQPHPLTSTLL